MTFQDLIIVYWVDPNDGAADKTVWIDEFANFADLITESRYYVQGLSSNHSLYLIDTPEQIEENVKEWYSRTRYYEPNQPPTVYIGFQGGPGWTLPEFHDILNIATKLPLTYRGIMVSWLPDNWFDHPGLAPTLTGPDNALEWLEQQIGNEVPEEIHYDFKGVHNDEPAPF